VSSWVLAIDFGTTNTCAAVVAGDSGALPVGFGPSHLTRMPSGVLLRADGGLLIGFEAERQAALHPDRYDPAPKRSVGQATLLLGDREVPVVEAVAAVLAAAAAEARRQRGGTPPTKVCLTHPARWGTTRQSVLRDAATRAGLGDVVLISEPEAAAAYFAKHDRVPVGRPIAVYDLGGGTLDVAVLAATPSGFRVVGQPGGNDLLGGEDVDERLLALMDDRAVTRKPAGSASTAPADVEWQSNRAALRREVRRAKEDLADSDITELVLPGIGATAELSRADLREAAGEDVDASVVEFLRTVELAGVSCMQLAGIYLAGGSSRLPLVRESLIRHLPPETHRAVRTLNDPKVAVAQGAAEILQARESAPVGPPAGLLATSQARLLAPQHRKLAAVLGLVLLVVGMGVWLNFRATNVVSGTVYSRGGDPVPNLKLQLLSGYSGKQITTTTDGSGRYEGKLPDGSYLLEAYALVTSEGQELPIELPPVEPDSAVVELPDPGGARLDLVLVTSGQRPESAGTEAADFFGGSVQPFSADGSVQSMYDVSRGLTVRFHFSPTGPLADGTRPEAFDATLTVGEVVDGSRTINDIPLGSYELSATLEAPSGSIALVLQDEDTEYRDSVPVPLASLCEAGCGTANGLVRIGVGMPATYR
jgi:hypothetical protein